MPRVEKPIDDADDVSSAEETVVVTEKPQRTRKDGKPDGRSVAGKESIYKAIEARKASAAAKKAEKEKDLAAKKELARIAEEEAERLLFKKISRKVTKKISKKIIEDPDSESDDDTSPPPPPPKRVRAPPRPQFQEPSEPPRVMVRFH